MEKKVYFISDAHLQARVVTDHQAHEERIVRWIDSVKTDAAQIWMLGDMFDFWFEFRNYTPEGYERFLTKLKEVVSEGVEVHFFTGNHDVWTFGYLENEIGLIVHRKPLTTEILGKKFFLAHGDGLNDKSIGFAFIRAIFHSKACQWLFRNLMPHTLGMKFGYAWSESNRRKHARKGECEYKGEKNEFLVQFAKEHRAAHPEMDYYIFGHRHILLHLQIAANTQMAILGDFMVNSNYATFDGKNFEIHDFENE